jgi:hypothetical protein
VIPLLLAQSVTPDFTAIAIQGGVGGILLFMLRWFMTRSEAGMKEMTESHDQMGRKIAASNDLMGLRIAASNDRMGRSHLMLLIALDGVNETAKQRAKLAVEEIDEALRQNEKEQKEREGGR